MSTNRAVVKRWTKTSLRALHLVGVAGVAGGVLFGLDERLWTDYWWLALASGALIMLVDIVSNPLWLVQIRGVAIIGKLVLLTFLGHAPDWDRVLLIAVIVISAVVAHAPGSVRYYSLFHLRVVNSSEDSKG
jgi:hypothetical protein